MMKKEIEKICFNCGNFFSASQDAETEYGICLNDEVFDPFIDFLRNCPHDEISVPLENMMKDKRFSYRLKQKMKTILHEGSNYLEEF